MAEKEFLLGVKARELLKHTKRETRVVTDDISPQDVRVILHKIAALEDIRDAREVCSQAINAIDRKRKEGFTKSTYWRAAPAPAQDHRLAVRPAITPLETAAAEPTQPPAGGPGTGPQAGRDTPVGITT